MRFPSFGRRRGASYNPAHSPVETVHLPAESLAPSLAYFIFIVVLQIAVIVLLAVVVFVDIVLQHYNDRLTSRGQLVYTLLVTATATLVGTTTEGELRKLWAYVVIKSKDVDRDEDGEEGAREGMAKVRKISVVLGLGKLGDMVRRVYIPVGLGLAGLVTTAIVTGLQPTDMVGTFQSSLHTSS